MSRLVEGPMDFKGQAVPARRKLTISVNLPLNNTVTRRTWSWRVHAGVKGVAP